MRNSFLRLLRKEVKQFVRPQYIVPLLLVPLLFLVMGQGIGNLEQQVQAKPVVGVLILDDGSDAQVVDQVLASAAHVVYHGTSASPAAAWNATQSAGSHVLIIVPAGFSQAIEAGHQGNVTIRSEVTSLSIVGGVSTGQVESILAQAGTAITMQHTGATPQELHPVATAYETTFQGQTSDVSPTSITAAYSSQYLMVPVILMLVIIVSGQMVMNSMGGEKENKTLETLLTLPVKRSTIVWSKLIGSALIGLVATGLYGVSIWYYQNSITGVTGATGIQLQLTPWDDLLLGTSLFLAVVGALALSLCLGVFVGDRQGAQVLLLPISVLAIVPMFISMFSDVTSLPPVFRYAVLAIPFTHPIIAPKLLLLGDTTMVLEGIVYVGVFAAAMIILAVRLFRSDILVTGRGSRLARSMRFLQR